MPSLAMEAGIGHSADARLRAILQGQFGHVPGLRLGLLSGLVPVLAVLERRELHAHLVEVNKCHVAGDGACLHEVPQNRAFPAARPAGQEEHPRGTALRRSTAAKDATNNAVLLDDLRQAVPLLLVEPLDIEGIHGLEAQVELVDGQPHRAKLAHRNELSHLLFPEALLRLLRGLLHDLPSQEAQQGACEACHRDKGEHNKVNTSASRHIDVSAP
mmetsp:Transcript_89702/g.258764  ORF Transcript_89702/g.258764 Transcript_89702/m.258764 type:complete len:215 (+) Transcript_89702:315-959(+)